jgi:hypothetical protein
MASHGGYRAPGSPAGASGPGALSQRTDQPTVEQLTALSSGKYGETAQLQSDASGAPVAPQNHAGNQALAAAIQNPGGFGAASAQPGTPVTDGAQYGPGMDASALQANDPTRKEAQQLAQSGVLKVMMRVADGDDATDAFRTYVRQLIAALA